MKNIKKESKQDLNKKDANSKGAAQENTLIEDQQEYFINEYNEANTDLKIIHCLHQLIESKKKVKAR